jgi:hypothetical protein
VKIGLKVRIHVKNGHENRSPLFIYFKNLKIGWVFPWKPKSNYQEAKVRLGSFVIVKFSLRVILN